MLQNIIKGFEYGFVVLVLDSYTNPPVYFYGIHRKSVTSRLQV